MTASQKNKVIFIAGVTLLSVLVLMPTVFMAINGKDTGADKVMPDWWPSEKISLGLDLVGGSYFVFDVQTEEAVKSRLNAIASQLRRKLRKKRAGVLRVRQEGERGLEVTLRGDRGVQILRNTIQADYPLLIESGETKQGRNALVHFEVSEMQAKQIAKDSVSNAIETIRNRVDQIGLTEPSILRRGAKQIIVQLPGLKNVEQTKKTIGKVAKLDFMLVAEPGSTSGSTKKRLPSRDGGDVLLEDEVLMSGDVIETARVSPDPVKNQMGVSLTFNSLGAGTFDSITAENVGRRLAIVLDGVVQSSPVIQERISGGTASITGRFSPEEARQLAVVLRSGALPAPLIIAEERTVGASLGQDSIDKGIYSMMVGSIFVIFFMIIYYRKAGLLAVGCLVLNLVYLLAMLALLGATLTLPGMAGLILTVGMAVDANVIIFERIREELRAGASGRAAVQAGFLKAHWTIMDANITTLLTALILYALGSGPIRGFAVTLSLGILSSLFSALYVGKTGSEVFSLKGSDGKISI